MWVNVIIAWSTLNTYGLFKWISLRFWKNRWKQLAVDKCLLPSVTRHSYRNFTLNHQELLYIGAHEWNIQYYEKVYLLKG